MPRQKTEDIFCARNVQYHRTPKEKRKKFDLCMKSLSFLVACFLIFIFQLCKRVEIIDFGRQSGQVVLPIFKALNLISILASYFYLIFIGFIVRNIVRDKPGNYVKLMPYYYYIVVSNQK